LDRFIVFLNKVFRKPNLQGRESAEAYATWEYDVGKRVVSEYMEPQCDVEGKKVLDIGCGLGGKTVAYGEGLARVVYGTDVDSSMADAGARFAENAQLQVPWAFFVSDAARLPLSDGEFDTVISNDAMEHFSEPETAIGEMARVTREGGAIWVLFTPHFSPRGSHLYDYIYTPWCHLLFRRRDLEGAIRRVLQSSPEWPDEAVEGALKQIMAFYDNDLNHMSIRRFFRLIAGHPNLEVTFRDFRLNKYPFLKFLSRIPGICELVTGNVICRLEKTG